MPTISGGSLSSPAISVPAYQHATSASIVPLRLSSLTSTNTRHISFGVGTPSIIPLSGLSCLGHASAGSSRATPVMCICVPGYVVSQYACTCSLAILMRSSCVNDPLHFPAQDCRDSHIERCSVRCKRSPSSITCCEREAPEFLVIELRFLYNCHNDSVFRQAEERGGRGQDQSFIPGS